MIKLVLQKRVISRRATMGMQAIVAFHFLFGMVCLAGKATIAEDLIDEVRRKVIALQKPNHEEAKGIALM